MTPQPETYEDAMFKLMQARLERDSALAMLGRIKWLMQDYAGELRQDPKNHSREYLSNLDAAIEETKAILRKPLS